MAPKKTAPSKQNSATSSFRAISWLKFLPNISKKRLVIGILVVIVLLYGIFVALRVTNNFICFEWPWVNQSQLQVNNLSIKIPTGWQRYYCSEQSTTLKDRVTSNWSKLSLAMGWGGYEYYMSPGEAGNIEVNSGSRDTSFYKGKTLDEVFAMRSTQAIPEWVNQEHKKVSIDGQEAIQITSFYDPDPREKQRHWRYQYYNTLFFYKGDNWYELRLWGDWYKSESRDAWVAKYEPVFNQLISTAEFK